MCTKRKQPNHHIAQQISDRAAAGIVYGISRMQHGFGKFMNSRTRHFSARTWKALVVLSALGWTFSCLYFFSSSPAKTTGHQQVPVFITRPPLHDSLRLLEDVYEQRSIKILGNRSRDTIKKQ